MIRIKVFGHLRQVADKGEITIDDAESVWEALEELRKEKPELDEALYSDEGELNSLYSVFLNGHNVNTFEGLETPLEEDDSLAIFAPLGGG